eukprot:CAMPEP_0175292534 /NCGR_PEP_ID=MMETSP0093-20121207/56990_1 /TAXON_ID=311494 /ORGANISM="Alexandrium monilatum, Strain CCMP3105" /LENGTH=60 /DNA_ID=CAMNT_0016588357 /DNA_START=1 /DNA_END=179 /DNA_ORIENTATION=-
MGGSSLATRPVAGAAVALECVADLASDVGDARPRGCTQARRHSLTAARCRSTPPARLRWA